MSLILNTGLNSGTGLSQTAGLYGGEGLSASYSSEAQQFLARIANPGAAQALRYSNLIDSLVAAGVWSKLDVLMVYAAPIEATALINLKSSSFASTLTLAPTFTAYKGFTTNGIDNFISMNYNPSTAGGNFVQDSGIFGLWSLTVAQSGAVGGSETTATNSIAVNPRTTGNTFAVRLNNTTSAIVANTDGLGFYVSSRVVSTTVLGYKNGVQVLTSAQTSGTPANSNVTIGKSNLTFGACQFAATVIGGGLIAAEHLAMYNALNTYLQSVGAV